MDESLLFNITTSRWDYKRAYMMLAKVNVQHVVVAKQWLPLMNQEMTVYYNSSTAHCTIGISYRQYIHRDPSIHVQ